MRYHRRRHDISPGSCRVPVCNLTTVEELGFDMRTIARLRSGVSVHRAVSAALLLALLLGVGSCGNPASPTNCKDACSQTHTQCLAIAQRNVIAPAAAIALCDSDRDACVAKCR
jgi:hypothetical protein